MISFLSWLQSIGLGHHATTFQDNGVDLDVVGSLSDQDLRALGLNLGDRRRMLAAVTALEVSKTTPYMPSLDPHPEAAERRQLTVLFCDLVDSTKLSQKMDPEELRILMRRYHDACMAAVSPFEGYIAQYLGDGVLVYFGYPKAHENEAERAVRAGLKIVACVHELSSALRVRIGIDTGLVVIGQGESLSEQERIATGDAPNVAARLQALAKPGSLIVSERTRQIAGGAFDYADLGAHKVKGIAKPIRVWSVKSEKSLETRFDAYTGGVTSPMVGRNLELDVALRVWSHALEAKLQVLLLCGEPGIGKSRVLRAIREELTKWGAQAWQYQCSPYFSNSALYPTIASMERAMGFERNEQSASRIEKLEAIVMRRFKGHEQDVNLIGRLFNLPVEQQYGVLEMTPQKQKDETIRALVDMARNGSEENPLLVLYEDVHWADPSTIALIDQLLRQADIRALVVMTYRPEFKPPWLGQPHVTQLTLNRLTAPQTQQVAVRVAGGAELPSEIINQVIDKTDGVPLFVEELTKAILESGIIEQQEGKYVLTGRLTSLAIPATLNDSLMARLDRLSPTKEVAQIGACIGREFGHELLSLVSPLPESELAKAIEQLVDAELVFRRGNVANPVYVFKHALVQDAASASLLKSRRAEIHRKIGATIERNFPDRAANEPELLAHHYTQAGLIEQAVPLWHRAGMLAMSRMALPEAIGNLDKGLALTARLTDATERANREVEMRAALGTAWIANGGWFHSKVEETLLPAWDIAEKNHREDLYIPVLWGLGANHVASGRLGEGRVWMKKFLEVAEETRNEEILLSALMLATIHQYWHGELVDSRRYAERIFERYDRGRHGHIVALMNYDPSTVSYAYAGSNLWILGYPDQALRAMDEKNRNAEELKHAVDQCFAWTFGEIASVFMGFNDRYIHFCNRAEQVARDQSLPFFYDCHVPFLRSLVWEHLHGPQAAFEHALATTHVWRSLGGGLFVPYVLVTAAESALTLKNYETALAQMNRALAEHVERPGWEERCFRAEVLRIKGLALEGLGDFKDAEQAYKSSLESARAQQARSWELRTAMSYARLKRSQGRADEALEIVTVPYDWFTEGFATKDLKEAKTLITELQG